MPANTPLVILSFNRPQFLSPTLQSIVDQRGGDLAGREVHLFQDGAVNRYSSIRYARDEDIAACVDTFRHFFPGGVVHHAGDNIGIYENFRRAERYCFEHREFECAYFFEDDLVLSPVYLQMLDELQEWASGNPEVAYFAAYGNYYADADEVEQNKHMLSTLDHQWAFGLMRRAWKQLQPALAEYDAIVAGTDYSRRDHHRIFELYAGLDAAPRASSQDAAKAFACHRLGLWRSNTFQPFARYIGAVGQHMTPEQFREIGFDRAQVARTKVRLLPPSPAQVRGHIEEQRALFREVRANELDDIVAGLPARSYDPLRLCTREEVEYGYRLYLNRLPEDEAIYGKQVGQHTVVDFVAGLTGSEEFRALGSDTRSRPATRADVDYAYRLALHRDPDGDAIYAEHVGRTDARVLAIAIWNEPVRRALWRDIETPSAHEAAEQ